MPIIHLETSHGLCSLWVLGPHILCSVSWALNSLPCHLSPLKGIVKSLDSESKLLCCHFINLSAASPSLGRENKWDCMGNERLYMCMQSTQDTYACIRYHHPHCCCYHLCQHPASYPTEKKPQEANEIISRQASTWTSNHLNLFSKTCQLIFWDQVTRQLTFTFPGNLHLHVIPSTLQVFCKADGNTSSHHANSKYKTQRPEHFKA